MAPPNIYGIRRKSISTAKIPGEFFPDQYVRLIEDGALGYLSRTFDSVGQFQDCVKKRVKAKIKTLDALFARHEKVVHLIQNPTLLKNPVETQANVFLAKALLNRHYIQIWHIHDLLEDASSRRTLRAHIRKLAGAETENIYGFNGAGIGWATSPNIFYAVINMKAQWAIQHLLLPKLRASVYYFPDAVDIGAYPVSAIKPRETRVDDYLARYCLAHSGQGYRFDPDAELLIAAEMARERKNTGEQILLLNMLNAMFAETGRKFQLLVTRLPDGGHDRHRIDLFKAYIRVNRLPVVMGFGAELITRGNNRPIGRFSMADLWNHPRAFIEISTAVKEGFGLNFINPAIASAGSSYTLPTVGRRLHDIFPDFEAAGMILPEKAYYDAIPVDASILRAGLTGLDSSGNTLLPIEFEAKYPSVPSGHCIALGQDFCTYSATEQILLMDCIDYKKLSEKLSVFIKYILDKDKMDAVAKRNAEAIKKNLSLKPYIDKLKKMVAQAFVLKEKRQAAGELPAMIRDNRKLSEFYAAADKPKDSARQ